MGRGGGGATTDEKVRHGLIALALARAGDGLLGAATHVAESNGLLLACWVARKTVNGDVVDVERVAYLRWEQLYRLNAIVSCRIARARMPATQTVCILVMA